MYILDISLFFAGFVELNGYDRQGITYPTLSKELSNSKLLARIRRNLISVALAHCTNCIDLSGMRMEDR